MFTVLMFLAFLSVTQKQWGSGFMGFLDMGVYFKTVCYSPYCGIDRLFRKLFSYIVETFRSLVVIAHLTAAICCGLVDHDHIHFVINIYYLC